MEIITLSTSRNILKEGSRDRARMQLYARHLNGLHIVLLTQKKHGFEGTYLHEGNLHIYPTHAETRVGMLFRAWVLAWRIQAQSRTTPILSVQDPLVLGIFGYVFSKLTRVPLNVQMHGDYYASAWSEVSLFKKIQLLFIPFILKRAVSIRVVSERIRMSLLSKDVSGEKIQILPIRPELDTFLKASRTRTDSSFVVLTASRFTEEKNIARIIAAFAEMRKKCPHALLRIVGSGPLETSLRALVVQQKLEEVVTFVSWTEHIQEEMVNADVFVLASLHEAYGLVLIESLATGVPVVTTDVGCVGEVVKDRVHGIVVQEKGVIPFADALSTMCTDEAFRIQAGKEGRALGMRLAEVSEEAYAKAWVAAHTRT